MAKEQKEEIKNNRKPRRRPARRKHAQHGGAWKVAYADFVTAMMALFMVLWILSQGPEVRQAIASYFNDPRGLPISQVNRSMMDNIGVGIMDHMPSVNPTGGGKGAGDNYAQMASFLNQESKKLESAGAKIMQAIIDQKQLGDIAENISVDKTGDGLRIELSDRVEGTFFDIGSSHPKENLKSVLTEIVSVLGELPNDVTIEGHTDARPYINSESGYSNWELSADRGNAVRRLMSEIGFPADRISDVRAFADKVPLPGTDPLDGRNRRISVFVKAIQPSAVASAAKGMTATEGQK